jgi:hypothetical protein
MTNICPECGISFQAKYRGGTCGSENCEQACYKRYADRKSERTARQERRIARVEAYIKAHPQPRP